LVDVRLCFANAAGLRFFFIVVSWPQPGQEVDDHQPAFTATATRTGHFPVITGRLNGRLFSLSMFVRLVQQQLHPFQQNTVGRAEPAVVTNLVEPSGQDMLEKSANKFRYLVLLTFQNTLTVYRKEHSSLEKEGRAFGLSIGDRAKARKAAEFHREREVSRRDIRHNQGSCAKVVRKGSPHSLWACVSLCMAN
jgi:hypothetical protein